MITYDKCKAIGELFTVLLDIKKYFIYIDTQVPRSRYDIEHKDFRIQFFTSGYSELFHSGPVYTRLCTVGIADGLHTVFKRPKEEKGYVCIFIDHRSYMNNDDFFTQETCTSSAQPLWINDFKFNQDKVESALFQISTVYNEEDADLVMLYNFIRNELEGSGLRLSITDTLLECTVSDVHILTELAKSRFQKMQEDYPEGDCE